jgi:hypothetical protein
MDHLGRTLLSGVDIPHTQRPGVCASSLVQTIGVRSFQGALQIKFPDSLRHVQVSMQIAQQPAYGCFICW